MSLVRADRELDRTVWRLVPRGPDPARGEGAQGAAAVRRVTSAATSSATFS